MKLSQLINKILSKFGVVLIRQTSFEKLSTGTMKPIFLSSTDSLSEFREISRYGVASLDNKIDEVRKELLQQQISIKWELFDYLERLMSTNENTETCPLCCHEGSRGTFPVFESQCIFGGGRLTRFQCPECDVIFGAKKMFAMNTAELTQDYESHYKVFHEGDSTEQEIRAFHLLNPTKDGVYLNYGAGGWSKSVQVLRSQGWNVFAFEPHNSAASDFDYLLRSKEDLLKIKFDGIFSNNVLEHLRYPVQELTFMGKILKPGAKMSHATPCFEYLYEYTRFHLFFFLGRSKTLLADKAGLVVCDFVVDGEFMCVLYEIESL
jgi:hypothetical protein